MPVTLRFLGALRHASGRDEMNLDCERGSSVLDVIKAASKEKVSLLRTILDEQLEPPKPLALILVNGREISALEGLKTKVEDGDEVVFVPVVHGG